jgi:hypothetical protein
LSCACIIIGEWDIWPRSTGPRSRPSRRPHSPRTIVLAAVAVVAAIYAKRSIDADLKISREATDAAQKMTQQQIESTHRPLLIDVTETASGQSDLDPNHEPLLQFPGGHEVGWDWRCVYVGFPPGRISVAVPLRNVGTGPAVIDVDGIRVVGEGLDREPLGREVHRERVPPGETTRILATYARVPDCDPRWLQVLVPYRDFAGAQATYADVRLECVTGEKWRVASIMPVPPENVAA